MPASGSPTHTKPRVTTPPSTVAAYVACRGASALRSRQRATADAASATGKSSSALTARVPVTCSWNSNSVTMPKLPPPPRSPQNSSVFSSAEARTTSPLAVTSSNETTLSQDRPCSRASQPMPPPRVRPPTPVCETLPAVVARSCGWVAASSAPSRAPPWTHARRRSGSTRTPPIGVRSIIRPPWGTASPTTLCPPQRTPISSPSRRAIATASTTSRVSRQRTIIAGRRSTMAFHTARASSYAASPGRRISGSAMVSLLFLGTALSLTSGWARTHRSGHENAGNTEP